MILKLRNGFTLAEVLITLGVIGVIAAITMPTLIKNYKKQYTVNKLKETYTILSQALQRAVVENGEPKNWIYNDGDFFVENYLSPYLKIIKKSSNSPKHYYLSGTELPKHLYDNCKHYYLINGVEITVRPYENTHYIIMADLNGIQGPNTYGKDCFKFQFVNSADDFSLSKSFGFNGATTDRAQIKANCKKGQKGDFCGALIMHDGWKIEKDYPW